MSSETIRRAMRHIDISVGAQMLSLYDLEPGQDRWNPDALREASPLMRFAVSTAKNGVGQEMGSFKTPLGRHRIRAKIGANAPLHTVFVGRRPTGEVWSPELAEAGPKRDWILTRILWLCGMEPGHNRFGACDTMRRYIYLHGSPPTAQMGEPGSIGCVRISGEDIIALFDAVEAGTTVHLHL